MTQADRTAKVARDIEANREEPNILVRRARIIAKIAAYERCQKPDAAAQWAAELTREL